jgi:uncharacterized protein involved in cysteine biosynthesis
LSFNWLIGRISRISGTSAPDAGFWGVLLQVFLLIIGFAILLIVCYFLFTILGGIVTAPFNENISQLVEEKITNEKVITGIGFWKDAYLSIKGEVQKLLFYFSILFVIFLLNFIPLIGNAVSVVLGVIFSFFFNALDFLDYPMQRKLMTFRQKLRVTQRGGNADLRFRSNCFFVNVLTDYKCVYETDFGRGGDKIVLGEEDLFVSSFVLRPTVV